LRVIGIRFHLVKEKNKKILLGIVNAQQLLPVRTCLTRVWGDIDLACFTLPSTGGTRGRPGKPTILNCGLMVRNPLNGTTHFIRRAEAGRGAGWTGEPL